MTKTIEMTITTVGQLKHALRDIPDDAQLYLEDYDRYGSGVLIEVLDALVVLPKKIGERSYIVLRGQ